ncbi:transposase [Flavobacterium psychrophilum]|nr:transposase [Flavobacterium psychrophilum]AOE52766.1 transposase [Flavobacterium psychrophilum]
MADTYTQIYIQIVFAVKGRDNLISYKWKDELYKYITGVVINEGQKLLAINGMPDHVHILIGLKPTAALSNIVRDIKANSSRFINDKKWIAGKFEWQQGFGAFSYSHSQLTNVINYIQNQEEHHRTRTFRQEYIEFLNLYNIEFKNEFIFNDV